ncbi:anti-sigma factor [Nocardia asteroides]|uniref:anti-sigma factor n=1 Tax=Nocardia asteroides TaxID=1824 RepID=UPI001E545ABE|nr:anti-sigma factor [Nocardia asteroides]UGT61467.1 anti-sigma factor [Nocardia asteroides]
MTEPEVAVPEVAAPEDAVPEDTVVTVRIPAAAERLPTLPTLRALAVATAVAAGLGARESGEVRDALSRVAEALLTRTVPGSAVDGRLTGRAGTVLVRLQAVTRAGPLPRTAVGAATPSLTHSAAAFRGPFDGTAGGHPTVVDLCWACQE